MQTVHRQSGFSLTEVLLAVATLAVGMLFVAGTFLLGVHFSRISTERSIGAVVAEEAFAKIRLFGLDNFTADPNAPAPATVQEVLKLDDVGDRE